jgi:hypothetical protein
VTFLVDDATTAGATPPFSFEVVVVPYSEDVRCPWCGAKPKETCFGPSGTPAKQSHRARFLLAVLGDQNEAAVRRIEEALQQAVRKASPAQKETAPESAVPKPDVVDSEHDGE